MDGPTESILVVVGHPIAGNPSQFAVERGLRSINLDWRVLSFDVKQSDIAAALEGFSVTGIVGVLITPSIDQAASQWFARRTLRPEISQTSEPDPESIDSDSKGIELPIDNGANDATLPVPTIDCLYRDEAGQLMASREQQSWIDDRITRHRTEQEQIENPIWFGETLQGQPLTLESLADEPVAAPPDPQLIKNSNLIVVAEGAEGAVDLEVEDWPENDGSTLVIDLTSGHPDIPTLKQRGYSVVASLERRVGMLQRCLERWTGRAPATEVIQDAIEEYLGV